MPVTLPSANVDHPMAGELAHARAVFMDGNRVAERWRGCDAFTILETGFGMGLNFLAAWDAARADPHRPRRLHFIAVDNHPFTRTDLRRALEPIEEIAPLAGVLLLNWPPPLAGFHRIHFDAGQVILTLLFGEAADVLAKLDAKVDAFFLDGFAPAKNSGMWSPEVVRELARLAAPGATLATRTVAGGVRSALGGAGFRTEKREAAGDTREMLIGEWREPAMARPAMDRHAMVLGAGLAGTLCAERLASRGWDVALVDAREERSAAAVGLLRPVANLRDAINARVSRSAFLYALQHYGGLQVEGHHLQWQACGALHIAESDDEAARFAAIVASQGHPPEFLAYVERDRAGEIAGREVARGGWHFPSGAWVSPRSLAVASLARAGARVRKYLGQRVERIVREGNAWRALDAAGTTIAEAPVVILANAHDARRLAPEARLTLNRVRGQVTYLPPDASRTLDVVVSGNGYVAPLPEGGHCVGATYQHDDGDESVRAEDHRDNLAKTETLLPGFTAGLQPASVEGWTGFRTTVPDRLPIFGACTVPGLYTATGLGSRGLLWAPLGAELIASRIESEPPPLPRDLAGAISPARFLS